VASNRTGAIVIEFDEQSFPGAKNRLSITPLVDGRPADFFLQVIARRVGRGKLVSGQYRLYSRKTDPKTGKRRNLGTFDSRASAEKHEREVQYFKRH
jgi:hypothetical protein